MKKKRVYLALGDSMSIDEYTGVSGGGAVSQLASRLGDAAAFAWELDDRTRDGCIIPEVPIVGPASLVTLTIGGNDLLVDQDRWVAEGLAAFEKRHLQLLRAIRGANPQAIFLVGNVYHPQSPLPERLHRTLREANGVIARNVARVSAVLIDIYGAFRGRESEYLCLEIEPSLAGATALADLFEGALS
ncbi:MAG: SGNH/GDSL hydrolase family protein [Myxococcota bacterium]